MSKEDLGMLKGSLSIATPAMGVIFAMLLVLAGYSYGLRAGSQSTKEVFDVRKDYVASFDKKRGDSYLKLYNHCIDGMLLLNKENKELKRKK